MQKTLLVAFPHPDDESVMAGGLIQRRLMEGWRVVVVCLTNGEKGKIHTNGSGRSTSEIRSAEFFQAMKILGVTESYLWDYPDGQLRQNKKWRDKLSDFIDKTNPNVVVTYDPSGVTGHPDHTALALFVLDKLKSKKKVELWWPSLSGKARELIADKRVADLLPEADFRLDLSLVEVIKKWKAISAHQSQGWAKIGSVWLICLGWLLKNRLEEYAIADLKRQYSHRYVKFNF